MTGVLGVVGAAMLLAAAAPAQAPGPHGGAPAVAVARALAEGWDLVDREHVIEARDRFRAVRIQAPGNVDGLLGLGEVYLLLGWPHLALRYADVSRERYPDSSRCAALHVRALIRARRFVLAAETADTAWRAGLDGVEMRAAHGSALFRLQRIEEAAEAYRRVLRLDPLHAEAHLRLGSGLTEPRAFTPTDALRRGVAAFERGDLEASVAAFRAALGERAGDPVAHRLLGEALLRRSAERSVAATSTAYRALREALTVPPPLQIAVDKFVPAYAKLDGARRVVVERSLALFAPYIPKLITMGGRHDLLLELERTTDAIERRALRGRRTFDGRVWDDVRGMGGLRAATGIEALDDAERFGFDTFAHEIAHQVHLFAFSRKDRQRIRHLYREAKRHDRFLDYYAASNEAEYFGQGVEAFVSLGKRPGREPTHGHTRFELFRRDRPLHDLIAELVSHDPLLDSPRRDALLRAAIDVALVVGRVEDAVTAAGLLGDVAERERQLARARRAAALHRTH